MNAITLPGAQAAQGFLAGAAKKLLIGGDWLPAQSGKTFAAINPATRPGVLWVLSEIAITFVAIVLSHLPGNMLQYAHPHQQGKHQGQQNRPPIQGQTTLIRYCRNLIIRQNNTRDFRIFRAQSTTPRPYKN